VTAARSPSSAVALATVRATLLQLPPMLLASSLMAVAAVAAEAPAVAPVAAARGMTLEVILTARERAARATMAAPGVPPATTAGRVPGHMAAKSVVVLPPLVSSDTQTRTAQRSVRGIACRRRAPPLGLAAARPSIPGMSAAAAAVAPAAAAAVAATAVAAAVAEVTTGRTRAALTPAGAGVTMPAAEAEPAAAAAETAAATPAPLGGTVITTAIAAGLVSAWAAIAPSIALGLRPVRVAAAAERAAAVTAGITAAAAAARAAVAAAAASEQAPVASDCGRAMQRVAGAAARRGVQTDAWTAALAAARAGLQTDARTQERGVAKVGGRTDTLVA